MELDLGDVTHDLSIAGERSGDVKAQDLVESIRLGADVHETQAKAQEEDGGEGKRDGPTGTKVDSRQEVHNTGMIAKLRDSGKFF
jgi:hypothetical protein